MQKNVPCNIQHRCSPTSIRWFILVCITGLILFHSWSNAAMKLKYFNSPDNIVIYQKGSSSGLAAPSPRFDSTLQLLHNRMHEPLYETKLAVNSALIDQILKNETVVELTYLQPQSSTYLIYKKPKKFRYTKLLFPLTGKYSELVFLGNAKGYLPSPLGQLDLPTDLTPIIQP